jgi:formate hydrogenlyase transcriptional activator
MATAAFPVFSARKDHNHLQHQSKASSHEGDVVLINERNRAQSDEHLKSEAAFHGIIGTSPALKFVLAEMERVAPTDSTVLVLGETGTGKELVARAIHDLSARRGCPFVKVNCAAIPLDLLESELFGHEKGAFTGAIFQRIGRFEMANTGTLFLDEIGDLPLALQPKLLRVLQEQEFERLGSGRTHKVDVRVLAATNRDLNEMVVKKWFRSDLYYRLNVFPIELPPLRQRAEDIPQLVSHFVKSFAKRIEKPIRRIPPETVAALKSYSWPGNVRELQNLMERAVIRSNDGILPNPLPVPQCISVCPEKPSTSSLAPNTFSDSVRSLISQTLEDTGWVIGGPDGAAVRLGLPRTSLISKMKKFGISRPAIRSRAKIIAENNEAGTQWQSVTR